MENFWSHEINICGSGFRILYKLGTCIICVGGSDWLCGQSARNATELSKVQVAIEMPPITP